MTTRMLIDARHREETRVAIVTGNRIEEFDFESAEHKQLKGNIYLAKVTRVEPSLQAAFVDYGGNRHGFLAFSEIHPDYYQIPREDREALLREEAEHAAEEAALRAEEDEEEEGGESGEELVEEIDRPADGEEESGESSEGEPRSGGRRGGKIEAATEELRRKRMALRRRYKIQDVIKRRQVLLVQVVKEERGNKGAALSTYLSLAGRYCVLMPNTSHGGGISRKISSAADRKRLKSIIAEMNLPSSMGCIVRTAGLQRTKTEIRRDFDYLARLWDEIRENTLKSAAPALIHNDSDLIKRAIRDIYNREVEEVVVEGEDGYRQAKDFMRLLMPSHARRVKQYADTVSLFQRFGVEDQLAAMYHPVVQLKSGGYLVINPTEALVSIDINSGRSTREHNIEQTATATNLEAAREIARQLRLRDMAGLVVIDFIDMEHNSNVRKVEKAMKEALKDDRARIQVGRISGFGLMEMSRQRLRTGVLEASTRACPHCEGTGLVRTASSAGLSALRMLEEEAARGRGTLITLRASQEAAFYVLNNKRRELDEIETRYGVKIAILPDGEVEGARMSVEATGPRPLHQVTYAPIVDDSDSDLDDLPEDIEEEEDEPVAEDRSAAPRGEDEGEGERTGKRRRRRRRRGRRDGEEHADQAPASEGGEDGESMDDAEDAGEGDAEAVAEGAPEAAPRKSRRGRRGGRRRRENNGEAGSASASTEAESEIDSENATEHSAAEAPVEAEGAPVSVDAIDEPAEAPRKTRRRPRARKDEVVVSEPAADVTDAPEPAPEAPAPVEEVAAEAKPKPKRTRKPKVEPVAQTEAAAADADAAPTPEAKPKRTRRKAAASAEPAVTEEAAIVAPSPVAAPEAVTAPAVADAAGEGTEVAAEDGDDGQPRRGWWQRTFGA
ncbi:Rne/Rng family ribonuclease [Sphingobium sp. CR28]|uniref:Rne/Rng family ribonuclease n=1 Tax=Sphingobium sp. CR28 TaxID=3400272 RepID=UPI003FEE14A6